MSSLFVFVTGASRGIGRAVCNEFVKHTATEISFIRIVLVARSRDCLSETENQLTKGKRAHQTLQVVVHVIDLSQLDKLDEEIDSLMEEEASSFTTFDRVILINNAGTLGHLGSCMQLTSLKDFQKSIDLNVTSSLWLSIRFVQEFVKYKKAAVFSCPACCVVVNISSICAIDPFPTMSVYCAVKAARDMFYNSLAKEDCSKYDVKFLNYAPGACDTSMTEELAECDDLDDKLQSFFRTSQSEGSFINPEDTARRLVTMILLKGFQSGKHIDYWDNIEE